MKACASECNFYDFGRSIVGPEVGYHLPSVDREGIIHTHRRLPHLDLCGHLERLDAPQVELGINGGAPCCFSRALAHRCSSLAATLRIQVRTAACKTDHT